MLKATKILVIVALILAQSLILSNAVLAGIQDESNRYNEQRFSPKNPPSKVDPSHLEVDPNSVNPAWSSDPTYHSDQQSTHKMITLNAVTILYNDGKTNWYNIARYYRPQIIYGNDDADEGNLFYADHFYDPDTGLNYLGSSSYTAPNSSQNYFNQAISLYKSGRKTDAFYALGKSLHYLQDMNNPHHASNKTAVNSNHLDYEKWANDNKWNYQYTSGGFYSYSGTAYGFSVNSSVNAKNYYTDVNNSNDKSQWSFATDMNLWRAQKTSAGLIGLFFGSVGESER